MNYEAIQIIKAEHRSLAAVLNAANHLRVEIGEQRLLPNYRLLWAIIRYIEEFPETLHHPKEDRYLFSKLQARTQAADAIIATLQKEHRDGNEKIDLLRQALSKYEGGAVGASTTFFTMLEAFVKFHFRHMTMEERDIFPLAETYLTAQDWQEIAAAFRDNHDPMFGTAQCEHFRELFHQIVLLSPAPIGLAS